jgi:hypothetical protein
MYIDSDLEFGNNHKFIHACTWKLNKSDLTFFNAMNSES